MPTNQPTRRASYPADYIPYPIRAQITQINPKLDVFWQQHLQEVFATLSAQDQTNVTQQLLSRMGITWHAEAKQFVFQDPNAQTFEQFVASIPAKLKTVKILGVNIQNSMEKLRNYAEAVKIADYLENILEQIAEANTRGDLEQQKWKQKLHSAFIYAAADEIRRKKELILPENARKLHTNAVKVFINEVYLKQQLLGFWFKTVRNRQLAESPSPLINDFLRQEQRTRQLEIVRASSYWFVVAPMVAYGANPFTIRRFLQEDKLYGGTLLLNGTAVNSALLQNNNPQVDAAFRKQIGFIITISGNVRQVIIDFIDELDGFHENVLIPLLFAPFDASSGSISKEVAQRLSQYAIELKAGILQRFSDMIRRLPNCEEEFDYLYVSMRQLFASIIGAFQDFQTQPALLMNAQAEELFGQLVAYATFLEKRRADVFTQLEWNDVQQNNVKIRAFAQYAYDVAQTHLKEYQKRQAAIEAQQRLVDKPEGLMDKLFKRKAKQIEKLDELKLERNRLLYTAYDKLVKLPDEVKEQVVHMEFDTQIIHRGNSRSYAYPNGENGISELPIIFRLPENRAELDLNQLAEQMAAREIDDADDMDDNE